VSDVAVTVALPITAPVESVTVPLINPLPASWAISGIPANMIPDKTNMGRRNPQ
jgi:hypothetical protein